MSVMSGNVALWSALNSCRIGRPSSPYPPGEKVGFRVAQIAREKGVAIRPLGDVVVLMPPLAISDEELDLLSDVVFDCHLSGDRGSGMRAQISRRLEAWIEDALDDWKRRDLSRNLVASMGIVGAEVIINGRRYISFASNNYLGLAGDPQVGRGCCCRTPQTMAAGLVPRRLSLAIPPYIVS